MNINSTLSPELTIMTLVYTPRLHTWPAFVLNIHKRFTSTYNETENMSLFADDSTIIIRDKNLEILKTKIQNEADNFDNWCCHNHMITNTDQNQRNASYNTCKAEQTYWWGQRPEYHHAGKGDKKCIWRDATWGYHWQTRALICYVGLSLTD